MMRTHINHVLSSCFSALKQIKSIKCSLPAYALTTLVTALVHSQLNYCNIVFAGLPNCDIQRLQSVLNTAVRLVAGASRWDHVSRLLRDHHWLPVEQRIEYKLFMTVHTQRSTTLSGRPNHAVCRSDRQSRPQIRYFWLCRSATYHVITW